MPHEGYADPIMNDGPGFHSNALVSEHTSASLKPSRQATLTQPFRLRKPRMG